MWAFGFVGFILFFCFLRFLQLRQSKQYQLLIFCVFCFPVSWAPGRNFHPDKHPLAQLSPLHILYWCLHWVTDFGYWAIRENYSKNNSITHLCRHSIGLMFYWYAMVCRGFGSSSLKVWLVFFNLESLKVISNIKHIFFKNGLFKQHFVVQKICLSQSVCSFIKAILYPSRQDSSKEERCFLWKKQLLFCRMPHYSSWQLLHATDTAFLEEMLVFLWTDMFIFNFKGSIFHCTM